MWPTRQRDRRLTRVIFRWLLAVFFTLAGLNHFRMPAVYVSMIPPWLPHPQVLNLVAGACEVLGGIGVLIPRLRIAAGWGLIALLVAVFPANLHVALMGHMPGFGFSELTLWLRLPFQGVLIAWVAWVTLAVERNP
jgi:uncharacterized membrane protein